MKYIYSFLITLLTITAQGQDKYTFSGVVKDSLNVPLVAATIVVVNPIDSSMVTFGISDMKGNFQMRNVPSGEHNLQITYIGYGTFQQKINAAGPKLDINLGSILLSPENNFLEEIVVKAKHVPLVIKKDTLEYNADAFKTRKSDAVEDLLKKLPGVEVERDGNIKVQGEDVERVLVDGKEFFGDDPKIATKNLPAEIVDKVQVYDKQSEESEFSGVNDGNEAKTIDLKLKEGKKAGVFGTISAGYGSDERYTAKLQLNKFSSKMQATLLSNINNVNNVGFSIMDMMKGGPGGAFRIMSSDGSMFNFGGGAQGDNTSASSGFNLNYDFNKKLKLRSSYFFNYKDTKLIENTKSENFLPDLSYFSEEDNLQEDNDQGHRVNASLEYDIDSTTELRIKSAINLNKTDNLLQSITSNSLEDATLISSATQLNNADTDNLNYDGNATLRKRLRKKGRLIKSVFRFQKQDQDNNWLVDNIYSDISLGERIYQDQIGVETSTTTSGTFSFTEPLASNKLFTIHGSLSKNSSQQVQDFYDLIGSAEERVFNSDLSDQFEKEYNVMTGGASYRLVKKKTNVNLGMKLQSSHLSGNNQESTIVDRTFTYILPSFSLDREINNGNIDFRYSTSIREPSLSQLQPITDNRNPLLLYAGNPNLKPTYNSSFYLSLNKYDQFNFRSIFGYISATYAKDYITTSRTVDENFITTLLPVNVDKNFNMRGSLSYSTPLGWIPAKVRFGVNSEYNDGIAFINGIENDNIRKGVGGSLRIENKKKDHFDFSVKGTINFTNSAFSQSEKFNTSYVNTGLTSALEIYLTDGFSLGTDFQLSRYSQENFSTTNNVKMWNAFVSTTFGESQRLTLDIEVNDIFNAGVDVNRNGTAESISETTSSNLGRYGILKLSYSLSAFKPKNTFSIMH